MTTEANDTPTNATEGDEGCPECGYTDRHSRDCFIGLCYERDTLKAEITELRAQLNRVIESSSIAESGRLNAEAEVLRLREAGKELLETMTGCCGTGSHTDAQEAWAAAVEPKE